MIKLRGRVVDAQMATLHATPTYAADATAESPDPCRRLHGVGESLTRFSAFRLLRVAAHRLIERERLHLGGPRSIACGVANVPGP